MLPTVRRIDWKVWTIGPGYKSALDRASRGEAVRPWTKTLKTCNESCWWLCELHFQSDISVSAEPGFSASANWNYALSISFSRNFLFAAAILYFTFIYFFENCYSKNGLRTRSEWGLCGLWQSFCISYFNWFCSNSIASLYKADWIAYQFSLTECGLNK